MSEEALKTGIFVRVEREGRWQNVDIADLSNEDFRAFLQARGGNRAPVAFANNVAVMLQRWILEHVDFDQPRWVPVTEGLPDDGIEVLAYSPGVSDHYGEASGTYLLVFREEGHWCSSESGAWIEGKTITHWRDLDAPKKPEGGQ